MTLHPRLSFFALALGLGLAAGSAHAALTITSSGGLVRIVSDAADAIAVTCGTGSKSTLGSSVMVGSQSTGVACSALTRLEIGGGPGDNRIDLGTMTAADFPAFTGSEITGGDGIDDITGSFAADRVTAGKGNDTIRLGDGDDTNVWNNGDNTDEFFAGNGNDVQLVNGAPAGDVFVIRPDNADCGKSTEACRGATGGGIAIERTNLIPFTVSAYEVETLRLSTLAGNDQVTTEATPGVEQFLDGGDPLTFPGDVLAVTGFSGNLATTPTVNLPGSGAIHHVNFEFGGPPPAPTAEPVGAPTLSDFGRWLLVAMLMLVAGFAVRLRSH